MTSMAGVDNTKTDRATAAITMIIFALSTGNC